MNRNEVQTATENVKEDQTAKAKVVNEEMDIVETILRFYEGEVSQILFDLKLTSALIQNHGDTFYDLKLFDILVKTQIDKLNQLGESQKNYNEAFDILASLKFKELEGLTC